jgi:membrane-associated phospholipid phosphatase
MNSQFKEEPATYRPVRSSFTAIMAYQWGTANSPGDRLAVGLAYIINPFVLPPLLFLLVLVHLGAPTYDVYVATLVGLVFFFFVPLGHVFWLVRRRRIAHLDIPNARDRFGPLLLGTGSYGVAFGCYVVVPGEPLIAAIAACYALNTLLVLVITLRWKISLHVIGIAGFVSVILFVSATMPGTGLVGNWFVWLLGPLVGALMWARVRTRAHSPGQVLAGAGFGLLVPYGELFLLMRLGIL